MDKDKLHEMFADEDESVTIIDDGEWVSEGKYQFRSSIIQYEGLYYQISESRSGSYHTDYYYNDPEITEVVPREVTIVRTVWDEKK